MHYSSSIIAGCYFIHNGCRKIRLRTGESSEDHRLSGWEKTDCHGADGGIHGDFCTDHLASGRHGNTHCGENGRCQRISAGGPLCYLSGKISCDDYRLCGIYLPDSDCLRFVDTQPDLCKCHRAKTGGKTCSIWHCHFSRGSGQCKDFWPYRRHLSGPDWSYHWGCQEHTEHTGKQWFGERHRCYRCIRNRYNGNYDTEYTGEVQQHVRLCY